MAKRKNIVSICSGGIVGIPTRRTGEGGKVSVCGVMGDPVCSSSADVECIMPPPPTGPNVLEPFDFAVVRYRWWGDGGKDLDTRTGFIGLDPKYDGVYVGWARGYELPPTPPYLLHHGRDNTQSDAAEAVLVNFPEIRKQYPGILQTSIALRAFWYEARSSGNIELEFATYAGGVMIQDGTNFINEGGRLVQRISYGVNVVVQTSSDIDGQFLGTLVYDFRTDTARILISPPPDILGSLAGGYWDAAQPTVRNNAIEPGSFTGGWTASTPELITNTIIMDAKVGSWTYSAPTLQAPAIRADLLTGNWTWGSPQIIL